MEALLWTQLEGTPTKEGFESYIRNFPLGTHVEEARRRLAAIRLAEHRATRWAQIKDQGFCRNCKASSRSFNRAPRSTKRVRGSRSACGKRKRGLGSLATERHPAAFLRFLKTFPTGEHKDEALRGRGIAAAHRGARPGGRAGQQRADAASGIFERGAERAVRTDGGGAPCACSNSLLPLPRPARRQFLRKRRCPSERNRKCPCMLEAEPDACSDGRLCIVDRVVSTGGATSLVSCVPYSPPQVKADVEVGATLFFGFWLTILSACYSYYDLGFKRRQCIFSEVLVLMNSAIALLVFAIISSANYSPLI